MLRRSIQSTRSLLYSRICGSNSGVGIGVRRYYSSDFIPTQEYLDTINALDAKGLRNYALSQGAETTQIKQTPNVHSNVAFLDKIRIKAKSGSGGPGRVSFYRAKYIPEGPPDGGNGGKGASIIVRSDYHDNNLSHLMRNYVGVNGESGKGAKKSGADGEDIIIRVPPGTVIREVMLESNEYDDDYEFNEEESDKKGKNFNPFDDKNIEILESNQMDSATAKLFEDLNAPLVSDNDGSGSNSNSSNISSSNSTQKNKKKWIEVCQVANLDKPGMELTLLEGGKGGRGNINFATSTNRSPEYAQPGIKGISKYFEFELKIIADVGLVGYPNAGKSTLLSRVSNAIPKIRNYAFTTLRPYVGVVDLPFEKEKTLKLSKRSRKALDIHGFEDDIETITMADLPGILEGAHLNIGLGLDFLRHIERTKTLCYVIDMSNNGVPCIWNGKKLKVRPDRYKKYMGNEFALKEVTDSLRAKNHEIEVRSPWGDYVTLLEELEAYKPGLTDKPTLIIANKMDQPFAQDHLEVFTEITKHIRKPNCQIIPMSSLESTKADQINIVKRELKKIVRSSSNITNDTSSSSSTQ